MSGWLQRARSSTLGQFATNWTAQRAGDSAILIAWQLLFSLFPLVVGLLAIVGFVLRDPDRLATVARTITSQFPAQADELLSFIGETRQLNGIFGLVILLGLLWSGANLFSVMAAVFNRFYCAPDRTFARERLVDFTMMAVYAVLLTVSVGASSVTSALVGISEQVLPFEVPNSAFVLGWAISLASALLMFVILYRVVPNMPLSLWDVWPGALLSAVLFVVLTQAFPIYLRFLGGGFAAYKALGVFLLLMTWFSFLGMILVAGALLNATLSGHCRQATVEVDMRSAARPESGTPAETVAAEGPLKVVAWAGLTAAVTSLVLIVARGVAGAIWRTVVREQPPR